jgi:CRISPR-associated exonuclease Cas4
VTAPEAVMDDALWVPLSALQHYRFCPRQCALIHVEATWEENRLTAEGRVLHERVHASGREKRDSTIIVRGMRLYSQRHRLSGVADVVEFHRVDGDEPGVALPGEKGKWLPFPVEYKRGRPKLSGLDEEQLAGQALCLSEMLSTPVPAGALFYGASRRRKDVVFSEDLFRQVLALAESVRHMLESGNTPPPTPGDHCQACSLENACLPGHMPASVREYYRRVACDW